MFYIHFWIANILQDINSHKREELSSIQQGPSPPDFSKDYQIQITLNISISPHPTGVLEPLDSLFQGSNKKKEKKEREKEARWIGDRIETILKMSPFKGKERGEKESFRGEEHGRFHGIRGVCPRRR